MDEYTVQILKDTLDRVIKERDHYQALVIEARHLLKAGDLEELKRVLDL